MNPEQLAILNALIQGGGIPEYGFAPPAAPRRSGVPVVRPVQPFVPPVAARHTVEPAPEIQTRSVTPPPLPEYNPTPVNRDLYNVAGFNEPPAIDYGRFPTPPIPKYRDMPVMPERDFGAEQRAMRQPSLRAGLIGLLLGGGEGALAAVGGARQAMEQQAAQQYEQGLRSYQAQAARAEFENAQTAQRYRDELAARQQAINEATATRGDLLAAEGRRVQTAESQRQAQIILEGLKSSDPEKRRTLLETLVKYKPEDQAAVFRFIQQGGVPPTNLDLAGKAPAPMSVSQAMAVVHKFPALLDKARNNPKEVAALVDGFRKQLFDAGYPTLAASLPSTPPTNYEMLKITMAKEKDAYQRIEDAKDRNLAERKYNLSVREFNALETWRAKQNRLAERRLKVDGAGSDVNGLKDKQKFADDLVSTMTDLQKRRQQVFSDQRSDKISAEAAKRIIDEIDDQLREYDRAYVGTYLESGADKGDGIMTALPRAKSFTRGASPAAPTGVLGRFRPEVVR